VLQAHPVGSGVEPQAKSNLVHFSLKSMASGGNKFSYFSQNQLDQFNACSMNNKGKQGWRKKFKCGGTNNQ